MPQEPEADDKKEAGQGLGKLQQYEALLLTVVLAVLGYLVHRVDALGDEVHKGKEELLDKLKADSLQIEKVSNMVQLQAQDVNNTINRKIDAIEQRLPAKP